MFLATYGGGLDERTVGLHSVSDGVIFTGTLASNATLGVFQLKYGGGSDFVIAKLDNAGRPVWVHVQNDVDHEELAGSVVDSAGDVIVTGRFGGIVDFGGGALNAKGYDMFIAKYSGVDGSHVWSVRYGADFDERPLSIEIDSAGNIYVAGLFNGTTNLGGANMTSNGLTDAFVAKYRGSDGGFIWGLRLGGIDSDSAINVAADGARIAVAGRFRGTMDIGGVTLTAQQLDDIFLAGFDSGNGSPVWSARYGGQQNDTSSDLVAGGGSLYMIGPYTGSVQLGGPVHVSQGISDIYMAKYDLATGSFIWSRSFGSMGSEVPSRIILAGERIIAIGYFDSRINFGGGDLSSAGGSDVFVASVTQSEGAYIDAWRLGGTQDDEGTALAITPLGDIVLGGRFQGVAYFGSMQGTSAGGSDAFVFEP